jgi:hypothetical protein
VTTSIGNTLLRRVRMERIRKEKYIKTLGTAQGYNNDDKWVGGAFYRERCRPRRVETGCREGI